jgi:PBP superfamily domain
MNATLPVRAMARRVLFLGGAASVAAGLLLIPATRSTAAAAHGHGLSVTVKGPRLFNGNANNPKLLKQRSSVTVSQNRSLVNQFVRVSWKHVTGTQQPQGLSAYSPQKSLYAVMVAECKGTHPKSWNQCYGAGQGGVQGASGTDGPFNAVYGLTAPNGSGFADINVETTLENAFLGCDEHHPCSLVVVPGQGGNDVNFPSKNNVFHCGDHSEDAATTFQESFGTPEFTFNAQTGFCSWKDRITIPLHFSAAVNGCPLRRSAFTTAGSPMMARAMVQWLSKLCAGSAPLNISYDSELSEPTAMLEASGGLVDVALTTRPGSADKADGVNLPADRHYVYAPIGVSAVSVAYWIDNNITGAPFQRLHLDQRLLAKLLTTSYNFGGAACVPHQKPPSAPGCDKGIYYRNPSGIFTDKEFQKLNPKMTGNRTSRDEGNLYEIPTVQSGHSDMTWTMTRWIAASSAGNSFLHGHPDPWGMRVDKYYRNIGWPNDAFLSQDPYIVYANQYSPVFPLSKVAYYQGLNWTPGVSWEKTLGNYPANQPEVTGTRALIAILDQGDSSALQFPVADLRNTAGRYVGPTNAGMAAAVAHMTSNGSGTLQVDLNNSDPRAYPLTMVIYAMVPTAGTSHAKAAAIAQFLDFAAGAGQTPGVNPGQLPAGYLPLPASLRAQTQTIATEVANQSGTTPSPSSSTSSTPTSTPSPSAGGTPSGGASPSPSVSLPSVSPSVVGITAVPDANPAPAGPGRLILPLLLIFGGLTAIGGGAALAGSASLSVADRLRLLGKSLGNRSNLGRRN